MKTSRALFWGFLLSLLCAAAPAEDWTGKCVSVTDGDTIQVMHNGKAERVRLDGIDCPETGQAFGNVAKQAASQLCFGKDLKVIDHGKDKYGRTLGTIINPASGMDINATLVRSGYAWHYKQYSKDKALAQCETEARQARKGLWKDPSPIPPWDYRHGGNRAAPAPATGKTTAATDQARDTVYVTNTGKKYHRAGCRYLKSSIPLPLSQAAASYEPCSVCNPPRAKAAQESVDNQASAPTISESERQEWAAQIQQQTQQQSQQTYSGTPTGETTARGYQIYTGPRGGRFHYSKSGKKVYERRKR
jgi:endonuclease YncB( thermonuclease family)